MTIFSILYFIKVVRGGLALRKITLPSMKSTFEIYFWQISMTEECHKWLVPWTTKNTRYVDKSPVFSETNVRKIRMSIEYIMQQFSSTWYKVLGYYISNIGYWYVDDRRTRKLTQGQVKHSILHFRTSPFKHDLSCKVIGSCHLLLGRV